ncbi:MAG TPA: AmmeMemoRadiSam system protein B [Thermoanaerobaculia bacterium]|nr:AmmeMemoRadiSam system protein B [Thermoanaerobaculia bacterium]HUM30879.1 AmmeMemoRadiSam system protein B [Thermoanaerobaculia bacterium]HXK69190.1 AmmeMemoRadiSam system protein B [Thermoanaerobaculia bacterium]
MRALILLLPLLLGIPLFASVRSSAVAGSWYPGDPGALRKMVEGYLAEAGKEKRNGTISALIVPHAGYVYSAGVAAHAYSEVKGGSYDRVILLGTSHYSGHRGLSVGDYSAYQTPLGDIPVDREAVKKLLKHKGVSFIPSAHVREHSLEAQLPFLQVVLPNVPIVTILPGHATPLEDDPELVEAIREVVDDRTLVIVSTDFTHYGRRFDYVPFDQDIARRLKALDLGAFHLLSSSDPADFQMYLDITEASICGQRALRLLMSLFPGAKYELLKYATSGDLTGDYSTCVSYVAGAVIPAPGSPSKRQAAHPLSGSLDAGEKEVLLRLARATLEARLLGSGSLSDALLAVPSTGHLREIAGAFVTLNKDGNLRGCIGYIEGIKPLYQAVVDNAISASSRDYRFHPVKADELKDISVEVSVLSPLKPVDSWSEIKLGTHGVILQKGGRRAVFLPQVATETGWSLEEFLSHLAQKAGLPGDAWREGAEFEVFTAEVFHEGSEP